MWSIRLVHCRTIRPFLAFPRQIHLSDREPWDLHLRLAFILSYGNHSSDSSPSRKWGCPPGIVSACLGQTLRVGRSPTRSSFVNRESVASRTITGSQETTIREPGDDRPSGHPEPTVRQVILRLALWGKVSQKTDHRQRRTFRRDSKTQEGRNYIKHIALTW